MKKINKIFIPFLCFLCFQTVNAGWTKQNSGTLAWLKDIFFIDANKGWISGSDGTLLETVDGGKNWKQNKKFTGDTIRQIYFSDSQNGWLLCERDRFTRGANMPTYLLQTNDGGANWTKSEFAKEGREFISKIIFDKYGNAVAFGEGGSFFTLQKSGQIWKKNPSPARYLLLDGFFNDETKAVVVGAGGTILFTEDSGASWNYANLSGDRQTKFNSVFFINQRTGWAVGSNGKIFETIGGGKNWFEQKTPTTDDLTDVFFVNTAEGWAVGDKGQIIYTRTAGNVWVTEKSGINRRLEKVFFNGKKGWAVGYGGVILSFD